MEKNTGGPAFPTEVWDAEGVPQHTEGMTLRDYFAAKAMHGELASQDAESGYYEDFDALAILAYRAADAMLKARDA